MKAVNEGKAIATGSYDAFFHAMTHSFIGHLEGSHKARQTISSYKSDLETFRQFLKEEMETSIEEIGNAELGRYHDYLKLKKLKTNTRRRKLLTLQKFIRYLKKRKKLSETLPEKLPTPDKREVVPLTVSHEELLNRIRGLPEDTVLGLRNKALLWVLAETGILVSEASRLEYGVLDLKGGSLQVLGKGERTVPLSPSLTELLLRLQSQSGESQWVFRGFNRFGPLYGAMTARGIELLVKAYSEKLEFTELTPKIFRHSLVLHWLKSGVSKSEIQKRLGLKSAYAFRVFEPML